MKELKLFVIWMNRANWVVEIDIKYILSKLLNVGSILSSVSSVQTGCLRTLSPYVFLGIAEFCTYSIYCCMLRNYSAVLPLCRTISIGLSEALSYKHTKHLFYFWSVAASLFLYQRSEIIFFLFCQFVQNILSVVNC